MAQIPRFAHEGVKIYFIPPTQTLIIPAHMSIRR